MANLDDYNAAALLTWEATMVPTLNGIFCNTCASELLDVRPGVLTSVNPPLTPVECSDSECGYKGTRLKIS